MDEYGLDSCRGRVRETISGFPRYQNAVAALAVPEQTKVKNLARIIAGSFKPGCQPVHTVPIVGHADRDMVRERREPGFMSRISLQRALAVQQAIEKTIGNPALSRRVHWDAVGAGATMLAVPNPASERDRSLNRRVDVFAAPGRFPIVEIRKAAASLGLRLSESQMRNLQAGERVLLAGLPPNEYKTALARAQSLYPPPPASAVAAAKAGRGQAPRNPCQNCEGKCVLVRSKVPLFPLAACVCIGLVDLPFGGAPVPFITICRWFWWP
jgi:hypothetical protein